uniref:Uncharacterized protein n=1 Tax=Arion vulgaris TaxID=1028688 RepID=A0A0B6Z5R8_9EUPU
MVNTFLSIVFALLFMVTCSVLSEETVHETGIHSAEDSESKSEHHAHKRMAFNSPTEEEDGVLLTDDGLVDSSLPDDNADKRGSLFRFGKRQGSLFRFGKRGSLFRFGKRQGGTLFRFGKRGGTLFRFGRSGSAQSPVEDAKIHDIDFLRRILAESEYGTNPMYVDSVEGKRGVDSFHWGSDSEK